jgi:lysophospholipase
MRSAAEDFAPFYLHAGGVRLRAARFEADAPRGVCVLLNGQTEFIEKYFEVIDELRGRGFSVAALDWRGQGGSDRLLANPLKVHIADFAEYDEDLAVFMRDVVIPMMARNPDGRLIAMAHSMGGHILLRRLHDRPGEFAQLVLCAPMIGIQPRGVPWWIVAALSRLLNRNTPSQNFVWGMGRRDHLALPFSAQIVTSDPGRYQRTHKLLAANPALRTNGPTWGWLAAALRSLVTLHQPGYADAIAAQALLFGAANDLVCNTDSLRAFAAHMPQARYVEIPQAAHELLMERDEVRNQLWQAFDAFIL